ncbi:hypothetical protein UPYG_G00310020 [Umbra pygmaea]|uniref:TGF-beta receptor type-2 n=1 Tax=Umbra pygmaea TaxID=75934 RepID=A0ABD0W3V5_UMBPY
MWCWRLCSINIVLLTFCVPIFSFIYKDVNLCKWCDFSIPICEDSVCLTNCSFNSFCTLSDEICVAIWRKDNESMSVKTLCHNPQQPLENIVLSNYSSTECVMVPQPSEEGLLFVCGCQGEHDCNDKLIFDKGANGFSKLKSKDVIPVVVISLVPPFLVAIIATMAFYLYRTRQNGKQPKDWGHKRTNYQALDIPEGLNGDTVTSSEDGHEKLSAINGDATSDMSQVRAHELIHNAEQLPIQLEALVGKGRFAEVWKARLHHQTAGSPYEAVAVKIFPSVEYVSWRNECAILSDTNLEHENVVQFLTAEERGPSSSPQRQYWLIMAYHSLGNLQDFLAAHVLSWVELCALAGSVARGLAHLHSDTTPCGIPKVPVAHRDLKSSNILVKSTRECALCDFGLALRLDLSLTVDDFANSGQVGTARYMAPEVLESRVNLEDLEAFKQMDVYSMSLVLWEMVSRCEVIGEVKSYEPPFGSKVCDQPCVDSMRDLVLRDRGRPDIPTNWTTHQGMNLLCATITECWDHDPEARLTAHCVVERFGSLEEEMEQAKLDTIITSQNSQQCPLSGTSPDCDVATLAAETETEGTLVPAQIEIV